MPSPKVPFEEIEENIENPFGWCIACEEWTAEDCEPDTEARECPACGKHPHG